VGKESNEKNRIGDKNEWRCSYNDNDSVNVIGNVMYVDVAYNVLGEILMTKPTLHVLGLAHLPTIAADPVWACAYSQKIRRFSGMMHDLGYKIIFYGVEGSKVVADKQVVVLTEDDRQRIYGDLDSYSKQFFKHGGNDEAYTIFKKNATNELKQRIGKGDILCNPMGNYYSELCKPVTEGGVQLAPGTPFLVESGIGYDGILWNCNHVFESYAWMHYVYGITKILSNSTKCIDGDWYDTVVPNFYDKSHYKWNKSREDYFFMNCRIANRKGIDVAIQTVEATGDKLIIAGQPGNETVNMDSRNVEYIGYITEKEKIDLLAHAKGLFSTTKYIGPFEGIAVEAQLSGTPVITTNFGAYTETVKEGVTGFRGMVLKDFVKATKRIGNLDNKKIRNWAVSRYSTDVCGQRYDEFFRRLEDLWKKGWNELE
jgi:glycosyltransferase involved in cell wall biosynthesis